MWFLVFFCPPLYFVFAKKFIQAIISVVICFFALITIPIIPIAIILGFIAVGHAAMDYGRRERTKFATEQAKAIAKEMKAGG